MSYMPAGDEEDDQFDDGFIDNDHVSSHHHHGHGVQRASFSATSFNNNDQVNVGASSHHVQKPVGNGSGEQSVSLIQSQSGSTENRSEAGIFPRHQGAGVLSMEDFKRAVVKGTTEVVERCLGQGLSIDEPLRCGWTVLMYAGNYGRPEMMKFLISKGANPNSHCDMFTALMSVCSTCSHDEEQIRDCVQILAEAGADVDAKDRYQTTALMLASRDGHVLAVKELITRGADVDRQDSRGWTALTWATQRAAKPVVFELLNSGADTNIQHLDKLTVKDLAAHLPTDEMLALLEHRPVRQETGAGGMVACADKETLSRSTDLRYGELEVFLLGLDLPDLVSLFQQQLIDLNLLMTLTEQDLINAGVDQVGARKKLLDAVQALHKTNWQPSSLVSIHFNKQICCSDAVAILANSSKHLGYIGSSIRYVQEQLRRHPEQMTQPTEQVSSRQLVRHTTDAIQNAHALKSVLERLQSELIKEMRKRAVDPADFVEARGRKTYWIGLGCVVVGVCVSTLVWYRGYSLQKIVRLVSHKTFVMW